VSAPNTAAAPDPSEIAGRYEIEKKLGAGAFGTVFKARDRELGRLVAIKTIRLEGLAASASSLEDLLKRFKQEAQVAARLRHPNIVMLYDIGTWEGMSYISMEYVDGVGLDRVIKGSGKMAMERAAAIGAQVADALAVAHKHGIVHRDIKPANIMIEPGDHVKVTDFGIAKVTDSAEHLTVTGSLLGTPSYMSPEQARGEAVDGRSDLFSVGCILYEMVTGQRAFRGDSITALLFKIITEEPPSLRELDPTVSDEMVRIIGKALSKARETRYQDGRELADDLLAITRPGFVPTLRAREAPTLPPDAPPGDVPTLSSPPTAQSPPTIGSAATAAAQAAAAPTIVTPATARTPPPPPLPQKAAAPARTPRPLVATPPRRTGGGAGLVVGLGVVGLVLVALVVGGGWYLLRRNAAAPAGPGVAEATPVPSASPVALAETGASQPPEAAAPTTVATTAAPPSTASAPRPAPPVAGGSAPAPPRPAAPGPTAPMGAAAAAATPSEPAGAEFAHLDELPAEEADGRATGDALAQKYRSGGGSSYTTGRFRERPRVPRGVTLAERPAVGTLFYLHTLEQAYHRKHGRYATLADLHNEGLLALDVPFDATGFKRARYAFRLTPEPDGYRAEAIPQAAVGRAFIVDDTGKVRLPDE
jgi:serine/threonine protein kinase